MPREGGLISYRICCAVVHFLLFVLWRWDVEGLENLPAEGPVIVVANHISYWDPAMIAAALPRKIFFMAKKELFSIPVLGFFLKRWGVFPVDRGRPDRDAVKRTLELLKRGQVIGIFPEGARSKTGSLLPPSTGAAYFAAKTGVPVCPAGVIKVKGASSWGLFPKMALRIGPCTGFDSSRKQDLKAGAGQLMGKIQELIEQ